MCSENIEKRKRERIRRGRNRNTREQEEDEAGYETECDREENMMQQRV